MRKSERAPEQLFEAQQGFACPCDTCAGNPESLWGPLNYCARCGHGYLHIGNGEGSCGHCGSSGHWVEVRPRLPPQPVRTFSIVVTRTITQITTVTCRALSPIVARQVAAAEAIEKGRWTDESVGATYAKETRVLSERCTS